MSNSPCQEAVMILYVSRYGVLRFYVQHPERGQSRWARKRNRASLIPVHEANAVLAEARRHVPVGDADRVHAMPHYLLNALIRHLRPEALPETTEGSKGKPQLLPKPVPYTAKLVCLENRNPEERWKTVEVLAFDRDEARAFLSRTFPNYSIVALGRRRERSTR